MRSRERRTIVATEAPSALNWQATYEAHAGDLFAFLRRTTGDRSTAEDLLQETFARAIRASNRALMSEVRPWLFKIAANLAMSHLRRQRLFTFVSLAPTHAARDDAFDVEADQVRRALRSIPADQAICLTLALHDGFSRQEIAHMLGASEETIKSRMARGRRNFAAAYRRLERGLAR